MTFRVGQVVECVNVLGAPMLRISTRYTVSEVFPASLWDDVGIRVAETTPNADGNDWWLGFLASRFRPITDTKTEVSFTAGADPSSEQFDNRRVKVGASA